MPQKPQKPRGRVAAEPGLAPVEGKPVRMQVDLVKITADGRRIDLGTVAYWHRNPARRLWYRLRRRFFEPREIVASAETPPDPGDVA